MPKIKTDLKWRKKSTYYSKSQNGDYTRYILVCGMIVFVKASSSNSNSMVWTSTTVISEREFPERHLALENDYINAVIEEPLSKQDVTFVR